VRSCHDSGGFPALAPHAVRRSPSAPVQPRRRRVDGVGRIRELGVERVLYGSDGADARTTSAIRRGWAAFRMLPLWDEEFRTIAGNVAPYMK
jgi:hypothetical protein